MTNYNKKKSIIVVHAKNVVGNDVGMDEYYSVNRAPTLLRVVMFIYSIVFPFSKKVGGKNTDIKMAHQRLS